jgi:hypothetical protein
LSYILDDSKYKIIWSTWLQLGLALLVRFLWSLTYLEASHGPVF